MSPPLDNARWNHEAKVLRYRKLLKTYLTETERRFVERRLVEEKQACSQPIRIDQERQRPSMPTQSKAD